MPENLDINPGRPTRRSEPTPERFTAIQAAGRRRQRKLAATIGAALAVMGTVAAFGVTWPRHTDQSSLLVTQPTPTATYSADQIRQAQYDCLRRHGVTITDNGHSVLMSLPNSSDPNAPTFDDIRYQCDVDLAGKGYPIIARSPVPGTTITQILEVRFKPGTYSQQAQAQVDRCYSWKGVTLLPSAAPSSPNQRFRFTGNNEDESKVIFGCLSAIPGVTITDITH